MFGNCKISSSTTPSSAPSTAVSVSEEKSVTWTIPSDQPGASNRTFTIRRATEKDVSAIITVAQEAYFHPKIAELTSRKLSLKGEFAIHDVPRRIRTPENYRVFVCETEGNVVATVYYQQKMGDYLDENNREIAELGLLAIHPTYWKKYGIASKLIKCVVDEALKDRMRGIYIYAIGSREPTGTYSNSLLSFYEKQGFKFMQNRLSSPQRWYTNPTGIPSVIMLMNLDTANPISKMSRRDKKDPPIPVN